jgi:hypothetical protein
VSEIAAAYVQHPLSGKRFGCVKHLRHKCQGRTCTMAVKPNKTVRAARAEAERFEA